MSKTLKLSLLILGVLLFVSIVMVAILYFQTQDLEKQNTDYQNRAAEYETNKRTSDKKIKELEAQAKKLTTDLDEQSRGKEALQKKYDDAKRESERISDDADRLKRDKSDLDQRMSNLRKERDELMDKLKNRPVEEKVVEKIVYRDKPVEAPSAETPAAAPVVQPLSQPAPEPTTIVVENKANEEYWASVMRQKAALELELNKIKGDLSQTQMKIMELTKTNSDLEQEIGRLKNDKEEIIHKIKYGHDGPNMKNGDHSTT